MKWFSDYIFLSKAGQLLAEEILSADQVGEFAQKLARKHQTPVIPYILAGEPVEPDKCPECQSVMPETGPCWHNLFEEEETPEQRERLSRAEMLAAEDEIRAEVETGLYGRPISGPIPFRGEPMYPKVITESDEYF